MQGMVGEVGDEVLLESVVLSCAAVEILAMTTAEKQTRYDALHEKKKGSTYMSKTMKWAKSVMRMLYMEKTSSERLLRQRSYTDFPAGPIRDNDIQRKRGQIRSTNRLQREACNHATTVGK